LGWLWSLPDWKFSETKTDKIPPETVVLYMILPRGRNAVLGNLCEIPSVSVFLRKHPVDLLTISEH